MRDTIKISILSLLGATVLVGAGLLINDSYQNDSTFASAGIAAGPGTGTEGVPANKFESVTMAAVAPTAQIPTNNPVIPVPPGPVPPPIGYPPYPDGTPCIGTPKDPTMYPDKFSNPCDGKPVGPVQMPGPHPLPIGYPTYPDGTPCLGEPEDPTRFPNTFDNPCSGNPDGKLPPEYEDKLDSHHLPGPALPSDPEDQRLTHGLPDPGVPLDPDTGKAKKGGPMIHPKRPRAGSTSGWYTRPSVSGRHPDPKTAPAGYKYITQPGDRTANEVDRFWVVYKATGQVVFLRVSYVYGSKVVDSFYRYYPATLHTQWVWKPHPAKRGFYLAEEIRFAADGKTRTLEKTFRWSNDTLESQVEYHQDGTATVTTFEDDGRTVKSKYDLEPTFRGNN